MSAENQTSLYVLVYDVYRESREIWFHEARMEQATTDGNLFTHSVVYREVFPPEMLV